MATKKTAAKTGAKQAGKKTARAAAAGTPRSMPKEGRDPKGGLTAKGREYFNKKEGSHLRPGVQGPADTPEKMVRKGSFLRRHFTHPRGPMKDDKGEPTRLALSAHAWGEPVPKTVGDAKRLAAKGHQLLEQYHSIQDEGKSPGKKQAAKQPRATKRAAKGAAAGSSRTKVAAKRAPKKAVAKKSASSKATATRKKTR